MSERRTERKKRLSTGIALELAALSACFLVVLAVLIARPCESRRVPLGAEIAVDCPGESPSLLAVSAEGDDFEDDLGEPERDAVSGSVFLPHPSLSHTHVARTGTRATFRLAAASPPLRC